MTVPQDTSRMTAGSIDRLVQESLAYISLYLTLGMPPTAIAAVKTAMTYAKQVGREKEVQAAIKQIEANYNHVAIEAHRRAVIGQKNGTDYPIKIPEPPKPVNLFDYSKK